MLMLVIDDDYGQRQLYKRHLEMSSNACGVVFWPDKRSDDLAAGIEDLARGDVVTSIANINVSDFGAALVDYRLGNICCSEVVKALRATAPALPVFVMSGVKWPRLDEFCAENDVMFVLKDDVIIYPESFMRMVEIVSNAPH